MQDKEFDRIFGRTLGDTSGNSPTSSGWAALSDRLDARRRRLFGRLAILGALLLAVLTIGNIYWYRQWLAADSQSKNLYHKILDIQRDTTITQRVIIQTDTIYRRVVVLEKSGFTSNTDFADPAKHTLSRQTIAPTSETRLALSSDVDQQQVPIAFPTNSTNQTLIHVENNDSELITGLPPQMQPKQTDSGTNQPAALIDKAKDTLQNFDNEFIIKKKPGFAPKWKIGGQLLFSRFHNDRLVRAEMPGAGVSVELDWRPKWKWSFSSQFGKANLKSEDADLLFLYSGYGGPGDSWILKYWESHNAPVISFQTALHYKVWKRNNFQGYIGLGAQMAGLGHFDIESEYITQGDEFETNLSSYLEGYEWTPGLLLTTGMERNLKKRWSIGVDLSTIRRFNATHLLHNQWVLSFKTMYNL